MDARENLDQGGLAGAVLPDQPVHLTGTELDVSILEGMNSAEALLGVFE